MMWRIAVIVGLIWGMAQVARAEDAVLNPPVIDKLKATIDTLRPTAELVYEIESGEWTSGLSASLYSFTSNQVHLGRIKGGYLSSNALYTGVDVDLPGIALRYLGDKWPQANTVLESLAKYSSVGYIAGYEFEGDDLVHGPTFGATLRF